MNDHGRIVLNSYFITRQIHHVLSFLLDPAQCIILQRQKHRYWFRENHGGTGNVFMLGIADL